MYCLKCFHHEHHMLFLWCQVREQERYIAQQVRRQVRERRETHVQILADALQHEWQQERNDKLQSLARAYEESLLSVGHAHRSARENVRREPLRCAAHVVGQNHSKAIFTIYLVVYLFCCTQATRDVESWKKYLWDKFVHLCLSLGVWFRSWGSEEYGEAGACGR